MAGGLIQLVATGLFDLFLTGEPQITYFKIVYRRHTNFSTEMIPIPFTNDVNFGRTITCKLSRNGDLVRKIYVVIDLPKIEQFKDENGNIDNLAKFAWVRRIGYALIRRVEIVIGEELIDRQYGDWLNIWQELTLQDRKSRDIIIGDVPELTDFTNGKDSYRLYVPLQFWFNKHAGLALPVVALEYQHVKINVEIERFEKTYVRTPTHYINIDDDFVNFEPGEVISQTVEGVTSKARFISFDIVDRRLYLWRHSTEKFKSLTETDPNKLRTEEDQDALLFAKNPDGTLVNARFLIKGENSKFEAMPRINASEVVYTNTTVNFENITLKNAFILAEYIFLDREERVRFSRGRHEYLIEQIYFNGRRIVDGLTKDYRIGFTQPVKELVWVTKLSETEELRVNQTFNYTDSITQKIDDRCDNCNIITHAALLFNGQDRVTLRDSEYYSVLQPWVHHHHANSEGIMIYSFALHPENHQPSGAANTSKIDNIQLKLVANNDINQERTAILRIYGIGENLLRISNGISGLVFTNDKYT